MTIVRDLFRDRREDSFVFVYCAVCITFSRLIRVYIVYVSLYMGVSYARGGGHVSFSEHDEIESGR